MEIRTAILPFPLVQKHNVDCNDRQFVGANSNDKPIIVVKQISPQDQLVNDITRSLCEEMRCRFDVLKGINMDAEDILIANARAAGRFFLSTMGGLQTERDRMTVLEEFDLLTIQHLNLK